ncbi:unnamed protein product [Psylliodes chrysocephalus]|uniref:Uncharacterized protein n=1 Tax=Psylliodes chrysocephalus TaxID=3402493 RepID=A0A9P0CII5_9CUCU|nr:unnamed protein product [Psylliodes chrysocephala]
MKKDNHPVAYSTPPHDYHHYLDKSFESSPYFASPMRGIFKQSSNKIYDSPSSSNYNYMDSYKTLPVGTGRSHLSTNNTPLENLKFFFKAIKRMNLTEVVFKEMKLETSACKRKFVCEADFNIKQSTMLKTIFNVFM